MAVITNPTAVREMYAEFAERGISVPCFCAENQRTIEAILKGVALVSREVGAEDLPIFIAFTASYAHRPQAMNWSTLKDPVLGALLCLNSVNLLAGPDGPFRRLRVLTLLDHGQPDSDTILLSEHLDKFSCVMFDASAFPFDENIRRTAEFVERSRDQVTVEGAVDEIVSAGGIPQDSLCTVERAQRFVRETGVDLIVPNVGTEHRSTAEKARYHGDLAREISGAVGRILALHGTSSLGTRDIERLKDDGIIKVNIWTRLERIGGQAVARNVLRNLGSILEERELDELVSEGLLGAAVKDPVRIERDWGGRLGPKLDVVAEACRRDAWVQAVKPVIREYLHAFGYLNYRGT